MKFDRSKYVAFDVETFGSLPEYALQPWRKATGDAWLTSFATARYTTRLTTEVYTDKFAERLGEFFDYVQDNGLTVVGWNVTFDAAWAAAYGVDIRRVKWLDAMLLLRHLEIEPEYETTGTARRSYGLKPAVAAEWPQYAAYGNDISFAAMDPESVAKRLEYNQMDAVFTLRLAEKYWNDLTERQQACALTEAACIPDVAGAILRGICASQPAAWALSDTLTAVAEDRLGQLEPLGVTEEVLRSPAQLRHVLFKGWGLTPIKQTDKGADSTDQETLYELAPGNPKVTLLKDCREALNNRTKFADGVLNSLSYNGGDYVHPVPRIYGTYSGRMTYASKQGRGKDERAVGIALHQWKRSPEYRDLLLAPPGYDLVEWDAANQEFRWMAELSGDETMLSLCMPGQDPHSFMGAQIGGVGYEWMLEHIHAKGTPEFVQAKQYRTVGKFCNLSYSYRVGAKKATSQARAKHGMDVDEGYIANTQRVYKASYPGVKRYWQRQINVCRQQGYAETLAGRRVQLRGNWQGPQAWSLESTAINFPIQGTGADQKYLALKCLHPVTMKYGAHFYYELHDGLFFIIPKEHTAQALPEMRQVLDNLPYTHAWGYTPRIPLPWDCKVGDSWGSMKEVAP